MICDDSVPKMTLEWFLIFYLRSDPSPSTNITGANCTGLLIRPGWPRSKIARSYLIGSLRACNAKTISSSTSCVEHRSEGTLLYLLFHRHAPAGQCSNCLAQAVKLWSWELQTAFRSKPVSNSPSTVSSSRANTDIVRQRWSKFCATWSFQLHGTGSSMIVQTNLDY